jgi:hypothetical protein
MISKTGSIQLERLDDFQGHGNRVKAHNTKLGLDAIGSWVSTEAHCLTCARYSFHRGHDVRIVLQ